MLILVCVYDGLVVRIEWVIQTTGISLRRKIKFNIKTCQLFLQ